MIYRSHFVNSKRLGEYFVSVNLVSVYTLFSAFSCQQLISAAGAGKMIQSTCGSSKLMLSSATLLHNTRKTKVRADSGSQQHRSAPSLIRLLFYRQVFIFWCPFNLLLKSLEMITPRSAIFCPFFLHDFVVREFLVSVHTLLIIVFS